MASIRTPEFLKRIPARPPETPSHCIDLSQAYTLNFGGSGFFASGPVLNGSRGMTYFWSPVSLGTRKWNGIEFDIRGAVQLSGWALLGGSGGNLPHIIEGIEIGREATRLHFLHGSVWTVPDGTEIGQYRIQYADGGKTVIPIIYGEHVRDWHLEQTELPEVNQSAIAWPDDSRNPAEHAQGRFYLTSWSNPRPDVEIARMEFISSMTSAAPFLVALTAE